MPLFQYTSPAGTIYAIFEVLECQSGDIMEYLTTPHY